MDNQCRVYAAPFDAVLPDSTDQAVEAATAVVQPDISVICDESKLSDASCTGAPDIAVETFSPSTSRKDLQVTRRLYGRRAACEHRIVNPGKHCILVYVPDDNGADPGPSTSRSTSSGTCTSNSGLIPIMFRS